MYFYVIFIINHLNYQMFNKLINFLNKKKKLLSAGSFSPDNKIILQITKDGKEYILENGTYIILCPEQISKPEWNSIVDDLYDKASELNKEIPRVALVLMHCKNIKDIYVKRLSDTPIGDDLLNYAGSLLTIYPMIQRKYIEQGLFNLTGNRYELY